MKEIWRVVPLATMQGCWQSHVVWLKTPPLFNSSPSSSFLFPLFPCWSAAAPHFCPFHPLLSKSFAPFCPSWKQVMREERGWMDSTGLLHKKINWASESGYWLMWGSVQYGSLFHHSLFHSLGSIYLVALIESNVTLTIYVLHINSVISQIPLCSLPIFFQNGI